MVVGLIVGLMVVGLIGVDLVVGFIVGLVGVGVVGVIGVLVGVFVGFRLCSMRLGRWIMLCLGIVLV